MKKWARESVLNPRGVIQESLLCPALTIQVDPIVPMPISAANRKRYPKNWPDIRAAIRKRAESRCEFCGVPDGAWIVRDHGPAGATFTLVNTGAVHDAQTGEWLGDAPQREYAHRKRTRVILTIAHLDHTPEHNDPANLRALCCRCHLLHDATHHRQTAYRTRHARKALGDLFEPPAPT